MIDKICGMFFMFISASMYLIHFALCALYVFQMKSYKANLGKMGTAKDEFGRAPQILALLALGLGIFYILRAEYREYKNTHNAS